MGVDIRLILLSYRRLYFVFCLSLFVIRPFVGGGDLVCVYSVSLAGGGILQPGCVPRRGKKMRALKEINNIFGLEPNQK